MTSVSLIIPTCHRPELLRECLNRLEVPSVAGKNGFEVIVTDDSRDDKTLRMVEQDFPRVRHVRGPRRGPASNRNAGASAATGEWLIFLDDDCLPAPDFLAAYVDAMDDFSGGLTALEGPTIRQAPPPSLLWEAPHNPEGGTLISCNFAMRKEQFLQAGRFDERYPGAAFEDTEFAARFQAKGGRVVFVPGALVHHPLRPCPEARKLAHRWEGKVIFALDQGAPAALVFFRLPWHVLRVIQSRFRKQPWSGENLRAAGRFTLEWLQVCWLTPGWVRKWAGRPRDGFWRDQLERRGPVPKYGF